MRRLGTLFALVGLLACGTAVSAEHIKAAFLGSGTYATAGDCARLRAREAGAEKTIANVPELLTAGGFKGHENGCWFLSIRAKGRSFVARMDCGDGPESWNETVIFKRGTGDSFDGTVKGITTRYLRCDPKKR